MIYLTFKIVIDGILPNQPYDTILQQNIDSFTSMNFLEKIQPRQDNITINCIETYANKQFDYCPKSRIIISELNIETSGTSYYPLTTTISILVYKIIVLLDAEDLLMKNKLKIKSSYTTDSLVITYLFWISYAIGCLVMLLFIFIKFFEVDIRFILLPLIVQIISILIGRGVGYSTIDHYLESNIRNNDLWQNINIIVITNLKQMFFPNQDNFIFSPEPRNLVNFFFLFIIISYFKTKEIHKLRLSVFLPLIHLPYGLILYILCLLVFYLNMTSIKNRNSLTEIFKIFLLDLLKIFLLIILSLKMPTIFLILLIFLFLFFYKIENKLKIINKNFNFDLKMNLKIMSIIYLFIVIFVHFIALNMIFNNYFFDFFDQYYFLRVLLNEIIGRISPIFGYMIFFRLFQSNNKLLNLQKL